MWDWERLTSLLSRTPCLSGQPGAGTLGGCHTLYLNGSHILGSCTELCFLCKPGINVIIYKKYTTLNYSLSVWAWFPIYLIFLSVFFHDFFMMKIEPYIWSEYLFEVSLLSSPLFHLLQSQGAPSSDNSQWNP